MGSRVLAASTLAAAAWLLVPAAAHATYCRAKACDDKPAYDDVWQTEPDAPCVRDEFGCMLTGTPLHWPQTCLSFGVQKDGSKSDGIDYDTAHRIISEAFQAWRDVDCPGGGSPSFALRDYGAIECAEAQYNQDQGNANVFTFRDESWPYDDAFDTLALTTITYNRESGEIYDADVEINSYMASFTVGDENVHHDLSAILTHEIGHFLGLSHNDNAATTMWCCYEPTDTQQRTLHQEDIAGICDVYPPDRSVNANACDPRHGFSNLCASDQDEGCGIGGPSRPGSGLIAAFGLLGLGIVLRRMRKSK
jgi:hypothetical protein